MAGWTGLEPATFCVTGRRSNQLSYHPVMGRTDIFPVTAVAVKREFRPPGSTVRKATQSLDDGPERDKQPELLASILRMPSSIPLTPAAELATVARRAPLVTIRSFPSGMMSPRARAHGLFPCVGLTA
jgi:hypothetical protein